MATPPIDIKKLDALQAQISVSISQARNLVDSWLPPATSTAGKGTASATPAPRYSTLPPDEDEVFKPKPPRLGLGAPIPKHFYDDDQKLRKDMSSVDLLKRRLLGSKRNASRISEKVTQNKGRRQNGRSSRLESESEDEDGRSALGKSKRQKIQGEKLLKDNNVKHREEGKAKVTAEEAGTGPEETGETEDRKKEEEAQEEEDKDKKFTNESTAAAPKSLASDGGFGASDPGKKKRKRKKKNKNKQNGGNPNTGG